MGVHDLEVFQIPVVGILDIDYHGKDLQNLHDYKNQCVESESHVMSIYISLLQENELQLENCLAYFPYRKNYDQISS